MNLESRWANNVDSRLDRIEHKQDSTLELMTKLHIDLAKLKIRAGFWGSAGATLVVLIWKVLGEL